MPDDDYDGFFDDEDDDLLEDLTAEEIEQRRNRLAEECIRKFGVDPRKERGIRETGK